MIEIAIVSIAYIVISWLLAKIAMPILNLIALIIVGETLT